MSAKHTPALPDACLRAIHDLGRLTGELHNARGPQTAGDLKSCGSEIMRIWSDLRPVFESYAPLLALAHQYADECGECAGTRICPDDSPCTECADVWEVIDQAEGRT
jgi:hypothetical protein